jgi:tetratricopeptide (TPR) repeat protein
MMKTAVWLLLLTVVLTSTAARAKSVEEYIAEAAGLQVSGDLGQAAAIMEEAVAEYPDNPDAYAYLGLYRSMQSGQAAEAGDFMGAGGLSQESLAMLNKAIELEPDHTEAHLYRGILGINLPEFMGVLDQGIDDLEFVVTAHEESPDKVPADMAASAYRFLGRGYSKKKQTDRARAAWQKVIELAPESPAAKEAEEAIVGLAQRLEPLPKGKFDVLSVEELKAELDTEPDNAELLVALGKAYIDEESYREAEEVLRKAISIDSLNAGGYKWLGVAMAYSMTGGELYDDRIHEDTEWTTKLVFEIWTGRWSWRLRISRPGR